LSLLNQQQNLSKWCRTLEYDNAPALFQLHQNGSLDIAYLRGRGKNERKKTIGKPPKKPNAFSRFGSLTQKVTLLFIDLGGDSSRNGIKNKREVSSFLLALWDTEETKTK